MDQLSQKTKDETTTSVKSIGKDVNDFFEKFSSDFIPNLSRSRIWPKIDLVDTAQRFEVFIEIPGIREEDLSVSLKDNNLVVKGEKRTHPKIEGGTDLRVEILSGSFYRMIPIPEDVDPDQVSASYKDGILMVTLQKLPESQRKVKTIPVQMSTNGSELGARH